MYKILKDFKYQISYNLHCIFMTGINNLFFFNVSVQPNNILQLNLSFITYRITKKNLKELVISLPHFTYTTLISTFFTVNINNIHAQILGKWGFKLGRQSPTTQLPGISKLLSLT